MRNNDTTDQTNAALLRPSSTRENESQSLLNSDRKKTYREPECLLSEDWQGFIAELRAGAAMADTFGPSAMEHWPAKQLERCGQLGVHRWFVAPEVGGWGWSEADLVQGYLAISQACLTTAFILTQRAGAMRRIAVSQNGTARERWLPGLLTGELYGTIGISHLTTSQQSSGEPALLAVPESSSEYRLNGFCPWITGAIHAQVLVVAAETAQRDQLLLAVDTSTPGIQCGSGKPLVALSGSCTDRVALHDVVVGPESILLGPAPDVMKLASTAGTGGLQTSTLAIGLACQAADFLIEKAKTRDAIRQVAEKIWSDADQLRNGLIDIASGHSSCTQQAIRQQANSLVLRATQAALTVAKGTGFADDHPAGRWARQALFFLVWSCPQPVAAANLCELAGLESF